MLQREYLFVGGMPEAVSVYQESRDPSKISWVHRSILDTYQDEFAKYAKKHELLRLQNVFGALPSQIGKKIIYRRFAAGAPSLQIKQAVDLLVKAQLASKVIHSHGNGIPIKAEEKGKVFKQIFLDIGLLHHMIGIPPQRIYGMDEIKLINEGAAAE